MRHSRYARRLLAAGIVMLGAGLLLAGPAGPANASLLRLAAAATPAPTQVAELTAGDSDSLGFAAAVTADGNTALIGAPGHGGFAGAAYVFTRTGLGWRQTAELTASDGASGDQFGLSVAITPDGTTAVIGAAWRDSSTGAAYVFTRTGLGWRQTAELTASDSADGDYFGWSVAITAGGTNVVIGAPGHDSQTGAAYAFSRTWSGWRQATELTAGDGAAGDFFGNSVAITPDGGTALIGAPYRRTYTGAAYVFTRTWSGWRQATELTASDGASTDFFGWSAAITADGNTALIGAYGHDSGTAYLFTRDRTGWQQTELAAADKGPSDNFGTSVAITPDGNTALIGAVYHSDAGAAYLFSRTRDGWQQTELTASDAGSDDEFGMSVAITPDGDTALVGAYRHDSGAGALYVFASPRWW
jgi:hypothetical protein